MANEKSIEIEATDLLLKWSKQPLINGKNIKELLKIDNTSVWWWMDDFLLLSETFCNNMKDVLRKKPTKKPSFKSLMIPSYLRNRGRLRKYIGPRFKRKYSEKPKILFLKGREYTYPIAEELKKDYDILFIDMPALYRPTTDFKRLKEKKKDGFNHEIFERYEDKFVGWNVDIEYKRLKAQYEIIKKNPLFIHKGKNLWKKIKPQFDAYFDYRLKTHLWFYNTLNNMISKERPATIYYSSETGFLGRMLCSLCKEWNIPVILSQHGVISYSTETVHNSDDFPKPTKVCVWGNKYKDLLVKQGKYPKECVVVTGNIRHKSKGELMGTDLYIGMTPYILCAPPLKKDCKKELIKIDRLCKNNLYRLILKLHPREPINTKNLPKTIWISQDKDPFRAIWKSDIVLVFYSSGLALEAMMLDKPIVLYNSGDEILSSDFIKRKVVYPINKLDELIPTIRKVLKKDVQTKNRKKYVKDCCYKLDGKAAERITEVIRNEANKM